MDTDELVKNFSDIQIPTSEPSEPISEELADTTPTEQTENVVDPQLEEATQLAELASQTALEKDTQAQELQAELEQAKQALLDKDKLINEMSTANELKKYEEFTEPLKPTPLELAYMEEEEANSKIDEYINQKIAYDNAIKTKEELERKATYSDLEGDCPGITDMMSEIEVIISKTPALQTQKGYDQIIPAYLIAKGVTSLKTPVEKPQEKPKEEQYKEMLNDENFKAFYEQQRLAKAKEQTPELPPMGKGGDTSLNIPQKPKTFDDLRNLLKI